jgi:transposase InsO family protein
MPWLTRSRVSDVRSAFLRDVAAGVDVEEAAATYGVSRSTAYGLVAKARKLGEAAAVVDKSRAPLRSPHSLTTSTQEVLLSMRAQYGYGPSKLAHLFRETFGEGPSRSAVANLIARHSPTRPYRRRRGRPSSTLTAPTGPNDVWSTDHKGAMGKQRVEPLTVVDLHSRYWLCCRPFTDKSYVDTREAFEKLFDENGTPLVFRVDGGMPWASTSHHRLTKLSAWWLTLGIRVEVVSRCQDNGIVERLHGTMEREMSLADVVDVRRHFEAKRSDYNHVRPHEALDMKRPADLYRASPRRPVPREPDYSDCDETRVVHNRGGIVWRGQNVFVSEALIGHTVGLRRLDKARWSIRFFDIVVGEAT